MYCLVVLIALYVSRISERFHTIMSHAGCALLYRFFCGSFSFDPGRFSSVDLQRQSLTIFTLFSQFFICRMRFRRADCAVATALIPMCVSSVHVCRLSRAMDQRFTTHDGSSMRYRFPEIQLKSRNHWMTELTVRTVSDRRYLDVDGPSIHKM